MKVPNYEQAIVPKEKLTEYLLNFEHIDGKSKALFYQKYGFEKENFEDLIVSLKKIISENDFDNCNETPWGKKYVVFGYLFSVRQPPPMVKTVWQIKKDDDFPRLITAYPEKKLKLISNEK